MNQWYKLDNAAKVFPAITSIKNSCVYRLSAVLTQEVDPEILQRAVDHIYDRFPMMFVKIRKGVFWHYFDYSPGQLRIQKDHAYPCSVINPFENDRYLVKIFYFNRRISIEAFHSLTDGGGVTEFLKAILYYYFEFSDGISMDSEGKIILAEEGVSAGEMEDSFYQNYTPGKHAQMPKEKAGRSFLIKGTAFDPYGNNVTTGVLSASALNTLAKSQNATITSYLVSQLIHSIYQAHQKYVSDRRPIVVAVPANLRKLFSSGTLRNFFAVVNVSMSVDNKMTLSDIIEEVNAQLRIKTDKNALQELISHNVQLEKKIYSRLVPLFLKKILIAIASNIIGDSKTTLCISNIGSVSLPSGISSRVALMEANLCLTAKSPINCAVCSVNDKLTVSFSRSILEADIIRHFFTALSEQGLEVAVYSNDYGVKHEQV